MERVIFLNYVTVTSLRRARDLYFVYAIHQWPGVHLYVPCVIRCFSFISSLPHRRSMMYNVFNFLVVVAHLLFFRALCQPFDLHPSVHDFVEPDGTVVTEAEEPD